MFEPFNQLWFRVRSRFTRETLDAELQEEIKLHAEFLREEALRAGASLDEATRNASLRLGNVTTIREHARERWSFGWLEVLLQDTKYAFRFLRRSPGFTAVAVLSLALILAAIGLYGILSFSVAQRTSEFGIRSALGARAEHLVLSVIREGMTVVAVGIVAGLALSWYASTAIAALLFQTAARDPSSYAVAAVVLALVAFVAAFVPAMRVARVDPATALRAE